MQGFIDKNHKTLFTVFGAVLVGIAFYTGFLEGKQGSTVQPVTLSCKDNVLDKLSIPFESILKKETAYASDTPAEQPVSAEVQAKFVGSKNSTKYYAPSCAAVKRIKPANYQWFKTAEDAELQGYTPGKC